MNKIKTILIICLCFVGAGCLCYSASAVKDGSWSEPVVKKALMSGLHNCYTTGGINNQANPNPEKGFQFSGQFVKSATVALPTGLTNVEGDHKISCAQLTDGTDGKGTGSFKGVFSLSGHSDYTEKITDSSKIDKVLTDMGYSSDSKCVSYSYENHDSETNEKIDETLRITNSVCLRNGKIFTTSRDGTDPTGDIAEINAPVYFSVKDGKTLKIYFDNSSTLYDQKHEVVYDGNWNIFKENLNKKLKNDIGVVDAGYSKYWPHKMDEKGGGTYGFTTTIPQAGASSQYYEAAAKAIKFLSGYSDYGELKFTEEEELRYYLITIKEWFFSGLDTSEYYKCDIDWSVGNFIKINIDPSNGEKKTNNCGINSYGITEGHNFAYGIKNGYFDASGSTKLTLQQVAGRINELSKNMKEGESVSGIEDETDSSSDSVEATCMNSAGAGALAWIVCPILEWMTDATETIYSSYVEPSLEVNTSLFEDTTTRDAWNIFQGFANTCFVILILAIIFSQLTGVGIDNYGIKKMLPKLIIVAILVNLSYLICILCVDLSNILGKAFKALFDGLPVTLNPNLGIDIGSSSSAGAIIAVLIASAIFIVAVFKNPGILLTALVAILGVLIAIFFLFILLSARQAAIVILTVVSPIAFVCYILPNTKTVFDKWLKLWEAMLFLFPICGLLIGGGNFASKILLNAFANSNQNGEGGNFLGAITAMLVGIIPIFFIPTLIKGAFAAMGTLGSKITGFGDRVRGGATGRIKNSERYKHAQERGQARQNRLAAQRRAGVYVDKDGNVQQRRRPSARLRRRVAGSKVGGWLGMDAEIGKNTAEFARQESARRGNVADMDITAAQATLAGADAKIKSQRIADQEALIMNGKAQFRDQNGKNVTVNTNDVNSLSQYHSSMLARAHMAREKGNIAEYNSAMDSVKAAQNLLSKTDTGRSSIQANLESAIRAGQNNGLSEAAGHLLDSHGDKYKSANRGAHSMISDLAVASIDSNGELTMKYKDNSGNTQTKNITNEVNNNAYDKKGTDKYTAETLSAADTGALQRLEQSFLSAPGSPTMSATERDNIAKTAYEALHNPNIHVKPEVEKYLKNLSAGYTPPANP